MPDSALTVRQVMQPDPVTIGPDRPVREALDLMNRFRVGAVILTGPDRELAGIFTERDLLVRVLAAGLPLDAPMSWCMTPDPVTVEPKDSVRTAIKRMEAGGYRHLPVVDGRNRPVGILSARRVVHYLVEHFPGLVYNLPPDPDRVPEHPDGA